MKADPSAQTALLDLQAQDSTIAQLEHRRKSLPEHETIRDLESSLKDLDGRRIESDTRVSDLSRDLRKAEAEVELVRTRRARDEERLNSGAVTNPKDLESLQHELVALERRIGTLEDEELEVMEALEEAQSELSAIEEEIAGLQTQLTASTVARDEALTVIEQQLADARAEREIVARNLPDGLIALYDKVRGQYGELGAAPLRARRCEGCRLEINSADLRELAAAAEDEVLRCPECSRILVRTPESGL